MKANSLSAFFALGILTGSMASAQSFDYPDFNSVAGLNQVLTTAHVPPILRVHEVGAAAGDNMGAVWYPTPVSVIGGFDTTFEFSITGTGGGDGMAFVVQNDTSPGYNGMAGANAIGRHASALGYGRFVADAGTMSIENALVVEIDHFRNDNQPAADPILDPDDNHISVHTGGTGETRQNEDHSIGRADSGTLGVNVNNGATHTVRVLYVPGTLEIFLNGTSVLTTPYDFGTGGTWIDSGNPVGGLSLIGGTSAYVGFTGSGGGSSQQHNLHSWSFDSGMSNMTTFCDPSDMNSTGGSTQLSGSMTNPGGSGLHLEAQGGPSGEFGYFLIGTGSDDPGLMVSDGHLCLDANAGSLIGRYNVTGGILNSVGQFNAAGDLVNIVGTSSTGFGFNVPSTVPIAGSPTIMAGSTWHFQLWHRDTPAGAGHSNFSNGLTVNF